MYVIILQSVLYTDGISDFVLFGALMSLEVQFGMQTF